MPSLKSSAVKFPWTAVTDGHFGFAVDVSVHALGEVQPRLALALLRGHLLLRARGRERREPDHEHDRHEDDRGDEHVAVVAAQA
jgi:hypothetical protein